MDENKKITEDIKKYPIPNGKLQKYMYKSHKNFEIVCKIFRVVVLIYCIFIGLSFANIKTTFYDFSLCAYNFIDANLQNTVAFVLFLIPIFLFFVICFHLIFQGIIGYRYFEWYEKEFM